MDLCSTSIFGSLILADGRMRWPRGLEIILDGGVGVGGVSGLSLPEFSLRP